MQQEKRNEARDLLFTIPERFLSSEALVRRACLMQITDHDFALEFIEEQFIKALEINDGSADAHFELGMFYDVVMQNSRKSRKHFSIAKQILIERKELGTMFDLLVTDMQYPETDRAPIQTEAGLKLIEFIESEGIKIPIIICSSNKYQEKGGNLIGCVHYQERVDYLDFKKLLNKL